MTSTPWWMRASQSASAPMRSRDVMRPCWSMSARAFSMASVSAEPGLGRCRPRCGGAPACGPAALSWIFSVVMGAALPCAPYSLLPVCFGSADSVADTTKTLAVPGEGPGWFDVRRASRRYLRLSPGSHREPVIRPISSSTTTSSLPRRDTSTGWGRLTGMRLPSARMARAAYWRCRSVWPICGANSLTGEMCARLYTVLYGHVHRSRWSCHGPPCDGPGCSGVLQCAPGGPRWPAKRRPEGETMTPPISRRGRLPTTDGWCRRYWLRGRAGDAEREGLEGPRNGDLSTSLAARH